MTTNDKQFTVLLIGVVALFTAFGYALAMPAEAAPQKIVKLERVVVVGKRAAEMQAVVQLPRVVVTGKRAVVSDDVRVASL